MRRARCVCVWQGVFCDLMGWTGITLKGWEVSHSTLKQITINNFPQLSLLCLLFAHILDFNQPLLRDTKALPLMGPLSRHAVISNPSDYRWNVWRKFLYFLFKKERFLQPLRFLKPSGMRCGPHLMKGVNEWLDGFFKDHYRSLLHCELGYFWSKRS